MAHASSFLSFACLALAMMACTQPTSPFSASDSRSVEIAADCGQDLQFPRRVHCTARLEAEGASVFALQWDMGDGRHAGGMSLSYAYVAAGSYTVRVRAVAQPEDWQRVATFTVPGASSDALAEMGVKSSSR
jgi:hypothetical protein